MFDDFDLFESYEDYYDEVSFDTENTIINPVKVTEDEDDWHYHNAFD